MSVRLAAYSLLAAASLPLTSAAAQEQWPNRLEWRGTFESSTALEFKTGEVQKADFLLTPEANADLGSLGRLTAIGRLRFDAADRLEPGRPTASNEVRAGATKRLLIGRSGDLELREFYLDSYAGESFFRLGKQQIVWGQADGLRVLDVVNPLHFREFILPDFEDRRIPLWTLQAELPVGAAMAQFLWIPDHSYDDLPGAGSTYAFTSSRVVPQPPAAVVGGGPVIVRAPQRPTSFIKDDDYGVRLTAFHEGWDISANYLYHYQDQAVPYRQALPGGGVVFQPRYERTHLLGGTLSNAFGPYTLRAEAAYSSDRRFITNAASDPDGIFTTGEFSYVLGLDYRYDADLFISGQLFQSALLDRPQGAARDRLDTTLSLLVEQELMNDRLSIGGLLLQSVNDGDGLLQADISYEWRSNVTLSLGADIFYGNDEGLFGQFGGADRITFGVEIGF